MEFTPHSEKQELALFSKKPIVACLTGIQWGKTLTGGLKTKLAMHTFTDPTDNFIITAPSYKILNQATLPVFLSIMDGFGEYRKSDSAFVMDGGGTCYIRSVDNPDSIVGITNVRFIWCDEPGLYSLYAWENIQGRAAFKNAQIILTSSPYTLNWIYKDFILPAKRGEGRDDLELIRARSDENPYFPKAEYERQKATMEPTRFNMMFGGEWDRAEGLVYDFDYNENMVDPIELPIGTKYVGGIDWGFNSPFALVVRAITPDNFHYQVSEFYKTGLTIMDIVKVCRQLQIAWGIEKFFVGHERPENITELGRHGIVAVAANNDVKYGVELHYQLLKERRYKVFRGSSPHTCDEYDRYHWPEEGEIATNKDLKEKNPVKQDDHAMDANRYVTVMTYRGFKKTSPYVPSQMPKDETVHQMIERFKKRGYRDKKTETWS